MMTPLQIYAMGEQYHEVADVLPDLKALAQQVTGKSLRRIGRFIQMALIGAARCAQQPLPSDTAIYFASALGDRELNLEVITQLFRDGQTPKPLNFVNTVSNAACFYIAQTLALQSRNNFVCSRYFAFENALRTAAVDLTQGIVESTLVGAVDIATQPIHEHRQRLQLAADVSIGEASHWLWLGSRNIERPRIADLLAIEHFCDREELSAWIKRTALNDCALSAGQTLSSIDFAYLHSESGLTTSFDYRSTRAYYDSQSAAVIGAFVRDGASQQLLHINADPVGRYGVMLVQR